MAGHHLLLSGSQRLLKTVDHERELEEEEARLFTGEKVGGW